MLNSGWSAAIIVLIFICGGAIAVARFLRLSTIQKYAAVQGWMLQAILRAEGEFGARTGKLKLSSVYAEFCKQMPWLAKVIPFEKFSGWVDDALVEMKNLLEKNSAIAGYLKKEETK